MGPASESMQESISTQVFGPIGDAMEYGKAVVKQSNTNIYHNSYNNKNGG